MLKQLIQMVVGNKAMTVVGIPLLLAGLFGAISAVLKGGMPDQEDLALMGGGLLGLFGRSGGNGSDAPA